MSSCSFVKLEPTRLHGNRNLGPSWIQGCIAEDPQILGLGSLSLVHREAFGGDLRNGLDLLTLKHPNSSERLVLLVQTGPVDDAQFVRALETWSKAPGTTTVLVSEEIDPRYLALLTALKDVVPASAIQMRAMKAGAQMTATFTCIAGDLMNNQPEAPGDLDTPFAERVKGGEIGHLGDRPQLQVGTMPRMAIEPTDLEAVDRGYWQQNAPCSVEVADHILAISQAIDPAIELTYGPEHMALSHPDQSAEFARFTPEADGLLLDLNIRRNSLIELGIAHAGLECLAGSDVTEGDAQSEGYTIRLAAANMGARSASVAQLIQIAYESRNLSTER